MGTSLTGLTPATTYDALIKVGDNGPLSATAKVLSDGLGNDSPLAMSTTLVGIGTTTPTTVLDVVGSDFMIFANNSAGNRIVKIGVQPGVGEPAIQATLSNGTPRQLALNPSGGNVGIGTTAPNSLLEVSAGTTIYPINITSSNASATTTGISMGSFVGAAGGANGSVYIASSHDHGSTAASDMVFYTHTGSALTEKGRFLATGGLTFNGDTAAANALDDYEEGTFTATLTPSTSGTITLSSNTCTYTKIGRQVVIKGFLSVGSVSSPVGTVVIMGGLPFTTLTGNSARGAGSVSYFPSIGASSSPVNYQLSNSTEFNFTVTASSVVTGDEFYVTLTYFV
jgi:hypothetical protein